VAIAVSLFVLALVDLADGHVGWEVPVLVVAALSLVALSLKEKSRGD
jgi:hypothetical protein